MRRLRLALVALVATAIVGCSSGTGSPTASAPAGGTSPTASAPAELTKVRYGFSVANAILWHPYYVAQELGYFEDEGLDVEFVIVSGAGGVMQQLLGGNIDIAVSAGPATLTALDADQDVVWYYTYIHEILNAIVTLEDSGITELADLKGKVVGISEPSGGEVPVLRGMMSSIGFVEGQDYTVLAVGEGDQLTFEALRTGQVDAYISSIFDASKLTAAGLKVRDFLPDQFRIHPGLGDVVSRQTLEAKRDVIVRFSRAIAKATLFSETNPDAAKAIAEKVQPELFGDSVLSDAWWEAVVPKMEIPAAADSDLYGTHYIPAWENYIELASQGSPDEGALEGPFDLDRAVDGSLLADINDFDHDAVVAEAKAYQP